MPPSEGSATAKGERLTSFQPDTSQVPASKIFKAATNEVTSELFGQERCHDANDSLADVHLSLDGDSVEGFREN